LKNPVKQWRDYVGRTRKDPREKPVKQWKDCVENLCVRMEELYERPAKQLKKFLEKTIRQ
jgi:hypothetical protein